jgi:hypothetical protein
MGEFLKCECPHCGQPIEYPSEGTGQIVPCPTCEKPVTLTATELPQADDEARRQKEWAEWKAAHFRQCWKPPRLTLPIQTDPLKLLPVFSDDSLRAIEVKSSDWTKTYVVNLLDYTCTCPLCLEIHAGIPPRDFGRLCKHIIIALRGEKLVAQLPPIARGIVDHGYPKAYGVYPGRFASDLNVNPIYITGKNFDGWINVYALARRNGVNYFRYGFNTKSKRWCRIMTSGAYNWTKPQVDESILF